MLKLQLLPDMAPTAAAGQHLGLQLVSAAQVPAMRPSPEQRDLVVGTAYEGQRGPRHYGNYVSADKPTPYEILSSPEAGLQRCACCSGLTHTML